MGRAGRGSGGGSRSSGGRSSSSRSSGGHRTSSSRSSSSYRAGSGSYRSRPPSRSGFYGRPPRHRPHYSPHRSTYYGSPRRTVSGSVYAVILILIIFIIVFNTVSVSDIPASTTNREKIDTGVAFQNDCVIDELGWFDNPSRTAKKLQAFYNKTGVQPFVYLKAYDSALSSDNDKLDYAEAWYEENIDNEGTFLFMYFAEKDQDNDVGYMCYVNGKQVTAVMDAEAVDIFWAYIDHYWYSDLSTDDMFIKVFDCTADRIMDKSVTMGDIILGIIIFAGCAVVLVLVIKIMKTKRKHEKEANEEAERILNTPLDTKDPEAESLVNKYTADSKSE